MNREIETLINNLEGCIGMFDYILTPIENNLLLIYINELEQENKELHNKIHKAIEYINKIELDNYDTYIANILLDRNSDLLEILKDSDVGMEEKELIIT